MTNEFYNSPDDKIPVTTIRSGVRNNDAGSVEAGFDKLPTEDELKRVQYGQDGSTLATLYEVTVPYLVTSYREGLEVTFVAALANTGAASISVNGLTNEPILDKNGNTLAAGLIVVGQTVTVIRNPGSSGTGFQLLGATTTAAGDPSTIGITSFAPGTATALQLIRINAAGNAVDGFDFSLAWSGPVTSSDDLVAQEEITVDVTAGDITKNFPTPLVQGDYYSISVFDSVNPDSSANELTLGRNTNDLFNSKGKAIDAAGNGNLTLAVGNYVKMVAISTSELKIVNWS